MSKPPWPLPPIRDVTINTYDALGRLTAVQDVFPPIPGDSGGPPQPDVTVDPPPGDEPDEP